MTPPIRTKSGLDFFEVASLLQKSLRRGDVVLAARAANELLPRYANYVWNRLMTVSAEDCADLVTQEVVALYDAWAKLTKDSPRSKPAQKGHRIFVAEAIVILARCKHSRDADELGHLVSDRLPDERFMAALDECEEILESPAEQFEIPEWIYDVHTSRGKRAGLNKRDFIRAEHDALTDSSTIFANVDEMIESDEYVQPKFDFD